MSPLIPSGFMDLCMPRFLKHSLTSFSSTKGASSLLRTFLGFWDPLPHSAPGPHGSLLFLLSPGYLEKPFLSLTSLPRFNSSWVLAFLFPSLHAGRVSLCSCPCSHLPDVSFLHFCLVRSSWFICVALLAFFPGLGCLLGWTILEFGGGGP